MKRILIFVTLLMLGMASCKKDEPAQVIPEIKIGENITEVVLEKETTRDIVLSGGNGKFSATVKDSKILEAKIDGTYLKLKALNYGETTVSLRSHDRRKTLTVKVERAEINISEQEIRLYPGQERQDIRIIGGGDDAEVEAVDAEEAIVYEWEAKTGKLKLRANHEGEAKLIFKTKDNKSPKELKIIVKAENNVSEKIGFYATTSKTLSPYFPVVMHAYRAGKMVWISSSPSLERDQNRVLIPPVVAPQKGQRVTSKIIFVNVSDKYTTGEYSLIVEEVVEAKKLVTLRGKGIKLVIPYDN